MYERENQEWYDEQIFIETKVPIDHSVKGILQERWGNHFLEREEIQERNRVIAGFLLVSFLSLFLFFLLQPPFFSTYQGELGRYKVNRVFSTVTLPSGEKIKYSAQNLNGVVHFVVGDEAYRQGGDGIYFAFNTVYGAESVDLGRFAPLDAEELDLYHALMRVTKDYRYVGGDRYEFTGRSSSIMIRNSNSGRSLLVFPQIALGLVLYFYPWVIADVGVFFYISLERTVRKPEFEQKCRLFGKRWLCFWALVGLYLHFG